MAENTTIAYQDSKNWYIAPEALSIMMNALSGSDSARYIRISLIDNSVIRIYFSDINFFNTAANGDYKQWYLRAFNTYIGDAIWNARTSDGKHIPFYMYARVVENKEDGTTDSYCDIIFSKEGSNSRLLGQRTEDNYKLAMSVFTERCQLLAPDSHIRFDALQRVTGEDLVKLYGYPKDDYEYSRKYYYLLNTTAYTYKETVKAYDVITNEDGTTSTIETEQDVERTGYILYSSIGSGGDVEKYEFEQNYFNYDDVERVDKEYPLSQDPDQIVIGIYASQSEADGVKTSLEVLLDVMYHQPNYRFVDLAFLLSEFPKSNINFLSDSQPRQLSESEYESWEQTSLPSFWVNGCTFVVSYNNYLVTPVDADGQVMTQTEISSYINEAISAYTADDETELSQDDYVLAYDANNRKVIIGHGETAQRIGTLLAALSNGREAHSVSYAEDFYSQSANADTTLPDNSVYHYVQLGTATWDSDNNQYVLEWDRGCLGTPSGDIKAEEDGVMFYLSKARLYANYAFGALNVTGTLKAATATISNRLVLFGTTINSLLKGTIADIEDEEESSNSPASGDTSSGNASNSPASGDTSSGNTPNYPASGDTSSDEETDPWEVEESAADEGVISEATNRSLVTGGWIVTRFLRYLQRHFIRKDQDDITAYQLSMMKAYAKDLEVTDTAKLQRTEWGGYNNDDSIVGTGAALKIDAATDSTTLVVDWGVFRKGATFTTITIKELKHIGGELVLSPASMTCSDVVAYGSDNKPMKPTGVTLTEEEALNYSSSTNTSYYRCYFNSSDASGKTVYQEFVVGDLARCQQFSPSIGTSSYVSTHYYWRQVVAISSTADDQNRLYIDLSATVCDPLSTTPKAGDNIVQFGYYGDDETYKKSRTALQIISAVGDDAPSQKKYVGVGQVKEYTKDVEGNIISTTDKPFSLVGCLQQVDHYDSAKGWMESITYGSSYVGDQNGKSFVKYDPENGVTIRAKKFIAVGSETEGNPKEIDMTNLALNSIVIHRAEYSDPVIPTPNTLYVDGEQPYLNDSEDYFTSTWPAGERLQHVGDYYLCVDGKLFQFGQNGTSWIWNAITDTYLIQAITTAKAAEDTATTTASRLNNITNDNYLTISEKQTLYKEYVRCGYMKDRIINSMTAIRDMEGTTDAIVTDVNAAIAELNTAYSAFNAECAKAKFIIDGDRNSETDLSSAGTSGSALTGAFNAYYLAAENAQVKLDNFQNKFANNIKDTFQSIVANNKIDLGDMTNVALLRKEISAEYTSLNSTDDSIKNHNSINYLWVAYQTAYGALISYIDNIDPSAEEDASVFIGKFDDYFSARENFKTALSNYTFGSVEGVKSGLDNINSDDVLSPSEKNELLKEWGRIAAAHNMLESKTNSWAVVLAESIGENGEIAKYNALKMLFSASDGGYGILEEVDEPTTLTAYNLTVGDIRAKIKAYWDAADALEYALSKLHKAQGVTTLYGILMDAIITAEEKASLKELWSNVVIDYDNIESIVNNYKNIIAPYDDDSYDTTAKDEIDSAFSALSTLYTQLSNFITQITTSSGSFTVSDEFGSSFRNCYSAYMSAYSAMLSVVSKINGYIASFTAKGCTLSNFMFEPEKDEDGKITGAYAKKESGLMTSASMAKIFSKTTFVKDGVTTTGKEAFVQAESSEEGGVVTIGADRILLNGAVSFGTDGVTKGVEIDPATGVIHAHGGTFDGFLQTSFVEPDESEKDGTSTYRLNGEHCNIVAQRKCQYILPCEEKHIGKRIIIVDPSEEKIVKDNRGNNIVEISTANNTGIIGFLGDDVQTSLSANPSALYMINGVMEFVCVKQGGNIRWVLISNQTAWSKSKYSLFRSIEVEPMLLFYGKVEYSTNTASKVVVDAKYNAGVAMDYSYKSTGIYTIKATLPEITGAIVGVRGARNFMVTVAGYGTSSGKESGKPTIATVVSESIDTLSYTVVVATSNRSESINGSFYIKIEYIG